MEEARQSFERIFNELTERFYVDSLLCEHARIIFVLESPHIQEIKYGAPVAGASGVTMSKHLFGRSYDKPLGRLIKRNLHEEKHRPALDVIGLMNICGIPMQQIAYRDKALIQKYSHFFDAMAAIRQNNHQNVYRDEGQNVLQDIILDRFRKRLGQKVNDECIMVPCGRFAQKFFRLAGIYGEKWQVIDNVPHPSYHSWDRDRYRPVVDEIKSVFEQERGRILDQIK